MYITDKQNKGLFVFDTVFTIIWITLSGLSDTGPDKESIENKMFFILYICVRRFFFVITDQATLVNTSTSDHEKHGKVR